MRRSKAVALEIAPRDVSADYKRMIQQIVEERVAEALADSSSAVLQPFFQPREISREIRARQTVQEQNKWSYYWEEFSCLICRTKEHPYESLGMCRSCHMRTEQRLRRLIADHTPPTEQQQAFTDTVKLARKALAPSIETLVKDRRDK